MALKNCGNSGSNDIRRWCSTQADKNGHKDKYPLEAANIPNKNKAFSVEEMVMKLFSMQRHSPCYQNGREEDKEEETNGEVSMTSFQNGLKKNQSPTEQEWFNLRISYYYCF